MFDFDLASLYETENRALKQAVKRNILCFPDDFMFQLTKAEWQGKVVGLSQQLFPPINLELNFYL
ncbi:hypothetical protein RG47T_2860 [Mucilaginibacter polytrichastri]|uniref:KilA-N DNA-binding domain-containing protein n=2 Tax=Mucilaginibacter polytrichastri TaxID=1302689 RepID=A0A1Q6A054_9SPHI|nr:hypothetical protein RG47T_2860 [Mucilaginibacter polytrichastri]SFT22243.1 ORF6N domain-containing protein [Mucilaginibacter polytrichastri]